MLEVRGLTKEYKGGRGIHNLNLTVSKGEVVALLGPNGAGKTTALKAMMGYVQPTAGEVLWAGQSILEEPEATRSKMGMMIGNPAPYGHLRAIDYLKLYEDLYPSYKETYVSEVLALVGLTGRETDRIKTFSTGMAQRICLAKALIHRPELLILDEPFSGMDIEGRNELVKLLKHIIEREGTSVLISSHQIHDIEGLTDKVCIVSDGQWVETAPASTIRLDYPTIESYYLASVARRRETA